nr:hypothetical protein [uncultured Sphaerochaeta sp.]
MGIHFREPDSYVQILEITPATRRGIEDAIEQLIALLDTLDPDVDLEPDTDDEPNGDDEPSLGWFEREAQFGDMAPTLFAADIDIEGTNEDGGDIQDEPHDARDEGDDEPNLGRLETFRQSVTSYSGEDPAVGCPELRWDLDGHTQANQMLREQGLRTAPRVWW